MGSYCQQDWRASECEQQRGGVPQGRRLRSPVGRKVARRRAGIRLMRSIGSYEIVSLLGDGGMGSVYKARDPRFDRLVAVKLLHPHYQRDPGIVQRFRSEAVIQAKLNHPGIVRVIDFVETGDELAMVQEYVEGRPLSAILDSAPAGLGESLASDLTCQVLSALGHAHARGLVHRDVKPANILVWESEGQRVAKVTDFGIAKILGDDKKMTATGAKMGTLAYMSPEHIRSPKSVDARSDLYSVGVTLYEMLSGRLPFPQDTEYELMRHVLEVEPPPLPACAPPASARLQAILDRSLSKDPADRFASAEEFAAALRGETANVAAPRRRTTQVRAAAPGLAPPVPAAGRGVGPWAVGALVGLAAVAALTFGIVRGTPAPPSTAAAPDTRNARAEAEAAAARSKAEAAEAELAKLKARAEAEAQAQAQAQIQAQAEQAEATERRREAVQLLRAELDAATTRSRALLDGGRPEQAREVVRAALDGVPGHLATDVAGESDSLRRLLDQAAESLIAKQTAAATEEARLRIQRDQVVAARQLYDQGKFTEAKNACEQLLRQPDLDPEVRRSADRLMADSLEGLRRVFAGTRAGPAVTKKNP